jgi:hypothetical protein
MGRNTVAQGILNSYVARCRQTFASCAFSFPLPQQRSLRSTCHRSNEPERGRGIGVSAFPSLAPEYSWAYPFSTCLFLDGIVTTCTQLKKMRPAIYHFG